MPDAEVKTRLVIEQSGDPQVFRDAANAVRDLTAALLDQVDGQLVRCFLDKSDGPACIRERRDQVVVARRERRGDQLLEPLRSGDRRGGWDHLCSFFQQHR